MEQESVSFKNYKIRNIRRISDDITKVHADVLITAVNSAGMWFGGIDGAIQNVAGNYFHKQIPLGNIQDLGVVVAEGDHFNHNGKFKHVIFVVDDLKSKLRDVIAIGLEFADINEFTSVSIPAIRTGVMLGIVEKDLTEVVDEWIAGIKIYANDNKEENRVPNVQEISLVTYNNPELETILHDALKREGFM